MVPIPTSSSPVGGGDMPRWHVGHLPGGCCHLEEALKAALKQSNTVSQKLTEKA